MIRQLVKVLLLISACIVLAACSEDGDDDDRVFDGEIVTPEDDFVPPQLPVGPPVFTDIKEPLFVNREVENSVNSTTSDYLTMLSYDPESTLIGGTNPAELIDSPDNIVVTLNTIADAEGNYEFTVFSRSDKIFVVDHESDVINDVINSTNAVCAIYRSEVPQLETSGTNVTVNVLDEELVYVETVEGVFEDCGKANKVHRYLKLPLDFDFTEDIPEFVLEDEARSSLVFGWEDDTDTPAADDKRLVFGYLGYAYDQDHLTLFDQDKNIRWRQDRTVETFDTDGGPLYLFDVTELNEFQYMVQIGRDIFVVDSTSEFFDKANETADLESILTDRKLRLESSAYIDEVFKMVSGGNLILNDQSKLYRIEYLNDFVAPTTSATYTIQRRQPIEITRVSFFNQGGFSQFDIADCADNDNPAECEEAHDTESDDWQFLTDCTAEFDCAFEIIVADFCVTAEEVAVDPTLASRDVCSPSNHLHLSELNDDTNDAGFLAHLQYLNFSNGGWWTLDGDRVFFNQKMLERDILVQYNYEVELAAPKPNRERILLGSRFEYHGLEMFLINGNLHATALRERGTRTEECYRRYQNLICDLGNTLEEGDNRICTGLDVANGTCVSEFKEYESMALLCSSDQIGVDGTDLGDGTCTDSSVAPVNSLSVLPDGQEGKWMFAFDNRTRTYRAMLMVGDTADLDILEASDRAGVEGILSDPELYFTDGNGNIDARAIGNIDGIVESVVDGFINSADIGRFTVIESEVIQTGEASLGNLRTNAEIHFVLNPGLVGVLDNCDEITSFPAPAGTPCVVNAASSPFDRISRVVE